jgi:hypothetical protein
MYCVDYWFGYAVRTDTVEYIVNQTFESESWFPELSQDMFVESMGSIWLERLDIARSKSRRFSTMDAQSKVSSVRISSLLGANEQRINGDLDLAFSGRARPWSEAGLAESQMRIICSRHEDPMIDMQPSINQVHSRRTACPSILYFSHRLTHSPTCAVDAETYLTLTPPHSTYLPASAGI